MSEPVSELVIDDRWRRRDGIGRFTDALMSRLPELRPLGIAGPPLGVSATWRLQRALRGRTPRLLFSPGFNPPLTARVPFVFTIHDLIHLTDPTESSPAKRLYYHGLIRRAGWRAQRVLTVSEYSRRRILETFGWPEQRVVVAHNAVSPAFHPDGPSHDNGHRPYLLYVGNHRPHKNLERLLRAFAQSGLADGCELHLTGTPTAHERALIDRLGIGAAVVHTGELVDDTLIPRYRGALALVCPSLDEGFGLPALEAMACGTAVIASDVAALPEVVGDAGVLVNPNDLDAIAAAMRRVVEDPELRRRLEAAGMRRAAGFNWDRTAAIVRQMIHEAAGAGPACPGSAPP